MTEAEREERGVDMKKIKGIFCLLLSGILCMTGCGKVVQTPSAEREAIDYTQGFLPAETEDKLTKIDENDRFVLYANLSNGEMAVEDKQEERTWYSNPVDKRDDGLASGFNKNALLSVLTVKYSTDRSVSMTCGGYMSSVSKDGLTYRVEADGSITFLFDFPNEEFRIPVQYALEEYGFTARILSDGILEYGTNQINSIDFLPFFGAGGREAEGYMLVPDGSGALIYYNNNKTVANTYSKELYGFDNGTNDKAMGTKAVATYFTLSQNQYLPVFGVNQNGGGFLAVITGGAGRAAINADIAGKYTLYNTIWTTYSYRTTGTMRQVQKDGTDQVVGIAEKKLEVWQDFAVSFHFLEDGRAEYADMASCYREQLLAQGSLTGRVEEAEKIPLYLDIYGYIEKTKSFLGIPVDTKIAMTTVKDVNEILDAASEQGVDSVILKYNYWMADSYYGKIPTSAKAEKKVGSKKELLALQERLAENGGGLYLSADLMNIYKLGKGVSKYSDVLQSVANTAQRQYAFMLDSAEVDTRYNPWYLLRPASLSEFFNRLAANMEKAGYRNLALDSIGEMCYSELSGNGVGRNQAVQLYADAVRSAGETMDNLLLTGANGYAAVYAAHILKTPARNSGYDIEDVSVPFYQMVFHGYVSYSLSASNLASNPADMTLKCMEYGAYPLYSLVGENVDELIGSRTDALYSADYRNWIPFMGIQYRQLNEVLGSVQTQVITGHEILSDDLRKVSYENGIVIYVNYGENSEKADGVTIPAGGYAVVRDGGVLSEGTAADYTEGRGY